ncbi:transcription factor 25-like isoform X2 [Hydractinia symbiolongicarpus]|nr:transcription factor 25-like isoform X2 [Hydractinia symbiolongicarpus]
MEDEVADEIEKEDEVEFADEENTSASNENKTKKRKNKKKKKKKKELDEGENTAKDEELDEIDRSVKEVNKMLGITTTASPSAASLSNDNTPIFKTKSILYVDPRNLSTDNEMKRKFGAAVVKSERRRNPHERRHKRMTTLVTPRQNWPPMTKLGLTMNPVKSDKSGSSASVFTFEHQEAYRKIQFLFYDAVESLDHNNIMALLNAHPYHIDSMLQLSEICKMNEDYQMAAELIERALYVFECSFHTLFNITQGICRLEYKRAENRPFFLALFRHIKYVGDKACYRTSLEFCKVLLGLDPSEDPLCVFFLIDYYALKAEEYAYFIQFTDEYELSRNVTLLPNFAFSYAMAKFYLGKLDEANRALRKALISFPSLLVELMDKCGISLDDTIKSHPYFDPTSYLRQASPLNQLISLYVGRCSSLWKPPEILDWLAENCKYIIDNMQKYKEEIENATERRKSRYKVSPRNVLRHIVISDIKEAMRALPVEVRNQSIMTHDPLPPSDSIVGYERPTRQHTSQERRNMLTLFLQSLMPSYNQENAQRNNQEEPPNARAIQHAAQDLNEGAAAVNNPIAGGAQQLMNAMRELLNTMTYRNDGVAQNEENDENENQEWNE